MTHPCTCTPTPREDTPTAPYSPEWHQQQDTLERAWLDQLIRQHAPHRLATAA